MRYQDAIKIGTALDGYVRCTYAVLYGKRGGVPMYAFNNMRDWNKAKEDYESELEEMVGAFEPSEPQVSVWQVPVVVSDMSAVKDGDVYAAVKLTEYAATEIMEKFLLRNGWYGIYKPVLKSVDVEFRIDPDTTSEQFAEYKDFFADWEYKGLGTSGRWVKQFTWAADKDKGTDSRNKRGDLKKDDVKYTALSHFYNKMSEAATEFDWWDEDKYLISVPYGTFTVKKNYSQNRWISYEDQGEPPTPGQVKELEQRRKKILSELLSNTYYVKECAIDWIPTNLDNAGSITTGEDVDLQVALEISRKKLDQAKALLITAGATNIL